MAGGHRETLGGLWVAGRPALALIRGENDVDAATLEGDRPCVNIVTTEIPGRAHGERLVAPDGDLAVAENVPASPGGLAVVTLELFHRAGEDAAEAILVLQACLVLKNFLKRWSVVME